MVQFTLPPELCRARNYTERIQLHVTSALLTYSWLVPISVWLVLYPFRIWTLGFYHDDWAVLRPPEPVEIGDQATQFASRPVLVLVNWAAGYLVGVNPIAWQAVMVLTALGSAFAISALVSRMLSAAGRSDEEARATGNISSAAWLALPWSLGYTAFATTFNGMVCLIAFCACSAIVLSEAPLRRKLWLGLPLTFVHGLTFEIFLGAPVLIAALYAVINRDKRRLLDSQNLILVGAFLFTQIALVAYNRLWVWLAIGQNKTFGFDAFGLFVHNLSSLPATLGSALLVRGLAFALLAAILAVGLFNAFTERRILSTVAILVVAGCCAVMSVMIYALGGYGIEAKGLFSRTTFGLSFWLPVGLASLAPVLSRQRPVSSISSIFLIAGLLIILSVSQFYNLRAWRSTWNFEKSVIASFPVADYMMKARPGTLLVIEAEAPEQEVAGFNAFWDISGALFTIYPQIRQFYARPFGGQKLTWAIATMLNEPRVFSEWNGSSLTQRWCAGPAIWTLSAPNELLVWRYPSPVIEVLRMPTTFGCPK
jgi:hypothetical protein